MLTKGKVIKVKNSFPKNFSCSEYYFTWVSEGSKLVPLMITENELKVALDRAVSSGDIINGKHKVGVLEVVVNREMESYKEPNSYRYVLLDLGNIEGIIGEESGLLFTPDALARIEKRAENNQEDIVNLSVFSKMNNFLSSLFSKKN